MKKKRYTRSQVRKNREHLSEINVNFIQAGLSCLISFLFTCSDFSLPWGGLLIAGGVLCSLGSWGFLFLVLTKNPKYSEYCC